MHRWLQPADARQAGQVFRRAERVHAVSQDVNVTLVTYLKYTVALTAVIYDQ